ncbi:hypothetical protein V6N11_017045 [Hibiscus sabdariffa]|uniref:ABC transporter family G domain-containing protein n=1 Tax=Hibiscus sabdariffa TaxID=183260 RepID=A0ABR2TXH5_9ROSI
MTKPSSQPSLQNLVISLSSELDKAQASVRQQCQVDSHHTNEGGVDGVQWRANNTFELADHADMQEWLFINLQNSSAFGGGDDKWQVRFAVTCWQLWKRRCSLLLDEHYVEKDDISVLCARLTDVYTTGSNSIMPSPLSTSAAILGRIASRNMDSRHFFSDSFGLDNRANTRVGDTIRRGDMIIGPTKALFMDDISNGLDSSTTFQVVSCLQHLVHLTVATALILLQPAPEIFELFGDVILMAEGKVVYHGPRTYICKLTSFRRHAYCKVYSCRHRRLHDLIATMLGAPRSSPMLRQGNIGAAKLALEKNGFAFPRYSDSSKVAYVLQGLTWDFAAYFNPFVFVKDQTKSGFGVSYLLKYLSMYDLWIWGLVLLG